MGEKSEYKIGWFSTGRDKAARDLFQTVRRAIEAGEIKAEICFVVSSREKGEERESDSFFELVHTCEIPLICLSSRGFKKKFGEGWRAEFEREVMKRLGDFRADLCVLAGYMLIVGEEMCQRYPMINLHPAAPGGPKGTWQEVIWQLIGEGAQETGVMMHVVTPKLDEGPPVTYCTFSLSGEPFNRYWDEIKGRSIQEVKSQEGETNPLFVEIRKHGLSREFPLIVATLKAFSEGRVSIREGKVVDSAGKPIRGYDLSREIDQKGERTDLVFLDLEGPLSPQDNAYELMRLFPDGERVFEAISRYDDILALEEREGYEPGDTLALIVPFLICHGVSEEDIGRLAGRASLVDGAQELITSLNDWRVFCISTSYEQYARCITQRVGIVSDNLACTQFPLDRYRDVATREDLTKVEGIEQEILAMKPGDDESLKRRLDRFFWTELPRTSLGLALEEVKPMGGRRKVAALTGFAGAHGQSLERVVVVGDSITDARMLEAVNSAGGLAIAFNANEYALPFATVGLASTDIGDLKSILSAWQEGGKEAVERIVREKERGGGKGDRENFHWLEGQGLEEPLRIHKRIRRIVREEAGKLG